MPLLGRLAKVMELMIVLSHRIQLFYMTNFNAVLRIRQFGIC
jgi:hypothetical protein